MGGAHAGLSSLVARERLEADGPNELPSPSPPAAWRLVGAQLVHFFAILLWIAGALAIVAGMPELGVAIFLVVIVNGVFAFVQEHRAERAAQGLRALLPRRTVVERDGAWVELDARELVTDDLVLLSAGDRICADVQLLGGRGLLVDCSTLTGESVPVAASEGERAFAGTFVVEGEAAARVTATAGRTELARIAELTGSPTRRRTPLARELDRLVRVVGLIAAGIGVLFFTVGAFVGFEIQTGFLFAIGVAVALVPEGLLPTVTLSLAMGASRMARLGALVRHLDAVETLGSTTFICSDKTGTLTCNQMSVVEVWSSAGIGRIRGLGYEPRGELEMDAAVHAQAERVALVAVRCSSGRALRRDGAWVARGDPMEAALHVLAMRLGVPLEDEERRKPELARFSFDPHRRRMSVVVDGWAYVKGAPDAVLSRCPASESAERAALSMTSRGLRVIAVATKPIERDRALALDDVESNLELVGLVGLVDPPRPEVKSALAACHRAGMRVAVVTGDHPGTACAIAREVGLATDVVVTGSDLPDDEALLGALIDRDGVVACRVTPEQKLKIARALQARGHVVAMTGDGVNDGPALRQADIGIAMGHSGTDVAREAADLVLLDDRFETIVHAIKEGRATFANIRRFLTYHLTDNVAELVPFALWALSGGRFPLALGVLQILCLDLLTDQFPALALGGEPPSARALDGQPHQRRLVDRTLLFRAFCVLGPVEAFMEMATFVVVLTSLGFRPGGAPPTAAALAIASGAAFTTIVVGQCAVALACRSWSRPGWQVPARTNPLLFAALAVSSSLAALLVCVPPLARLLGHAPPTAYGMLLALSAFPVVLAADAAHKAWLRRGAR
ncbi:MAG TPA: cation-transporting P-type ATPase [Polyangiaceae bacterium]|nr:cation-transporting P-type ATPase [Polyangiaceae bacterium]